MSKTIEESEEEKQHLANMLKDEQGNMDLARDFILRQSRSALTSTLPKTDPFRGDSANNDVSLRGMKAWVEAFIYSQKDSDLNPKAIKDLKHFNSELERNNKYVISDRNPENDQKFAEETLKKMKETGMAFSVYSNETEEGKGHGLLIVYKEKVDETDPNRKMIITRTVLNSGFGARKDIEQLQKGTEKNKKYFEKLSPKLHQGVGMVIYPGIEYLVGDNYEKAQEVILNDVKNSTSSYGNHTRLEGGNFQNLPVIGPSPDEIIPIQREGTCSILRFEHALRNLQDPKGFTKQNFTRMNAFIRDNESKDLPLLLNLVDNRTEENIKFIHNYQVKQYAKITSATSLSNVKNKELIQQVWEKGFSKYANDAQADIPRQGFLDSGKQLADVVNNSYGGELTENNIDSVVKDWKKEIMKISSISKDMMPLFDDSIINKSKFGTKLPELSAREINLQSIRKQNLGNEFSNIRQTRKNRAIADLKKKKEGMEQGENYNDAKQKLEKTTRYLHSSSKDNPYMHAEKRAEADTIDFTQSKIRDTTYIPNTNLSSDSLKRPNTIKELEAKQKVQTSKEFSVPSSPADLIEAQSGKLMREEKMIQQESAKLVYNQNKTTIDKSTDAFQKQKDNSNEPTQIKTKDQKWKKVDKGRWTL